MSNSRKKESTFEVCSCWGEGDGKLLNAQTVDYSFLILYLYFLQFTVSFGASPILSQHIILNNVEHACSSSIIEHVSL
jgi:hypothetical protein